VTNTTQSRIYLPLTMVGRGQSYDH